jgi:uncharacterized Rmd1/YagE family protein
MAQFCNCAERPIDALYLRSSDARQAQCVSGINELFIFADGMVVFWDMTASEVGTSGL